VIADAWFCALAAMLTGYAVLDGFDLGAGTLHLWLARTREERASVIGAIGPVWNGNEVWLIAAGGAMVAAFPRVYATAFSGFYLPLVLVLWLLLLRGLALEFRHQLDSELWHDAWDVVFCGASALLALLFGVAVGNVLRGVPLDAEGEFRGSFALLLNPFALLAGLLAVAVLATHGASYVAHKTEGAVQARARAAARWLWWLESVLLAGFVAASFVVRPDFTSNFWHWPWLLVFPAGVLASLLSLRRLLVRARDLPAFLASCGLVVSILGSVAAGLYPMLLPARPGSAHAGFDAHNAAAPEASLRTALALFLAGMALVVAYTINAYRVWRGKVNAVGH
jgi:cytochrome d ubiquinol oxidase subunit II